MKVYCYNNKRNICGNNVKRLRKKLKISQAELAARLQVSGVSIERDSISRIESGLRFVSDFELKVLAKVLNTDVNELVDSDKD
jgi:transcriptional regulator with XRE-family HTH domain